MRDFKGLKVWEKAHRLTLSVYRVSGAFPSAEVFGLTGQMRRASVSIPANISEGCGRDSDTELARFMVISSGSASELEYLLTLANDLEMIKSAEYNALSSDIIEIKQMLSSFIRRLRNRADS